MPTVDRHARSALPLADRVELRQAEITRHPRFAVFARTYWNSLIARGVIPSRKFGGPTGPRVVLVADLVAFLEQRGATAGQGAE